MLKFFDCNAYFGLPTKRPLAPVATVDDLVVEMDRAGVAKALTWHILQYDGSPQTGNHVLAQAIQPHSRLLGCWAVLPNQGREFPPPDELFQQMQTAHIAALRVFPNEHRFLCNAVSMGEWLDAMSTQHVPLFVSVAHGMEWRDVYALLADFPDLTCVVCDHGCWGEDRMFRPLLERYPNVYVDTSQYLLDGGIEAFVNAYGPDRLLYGSGFPVSHFGGMMLAIQHAQIPDDAKAAIAGGNLERLLALSDVAVQPEEKQPEGDSLPPIITSSKLAHDFWQNGKSADCPIYDMHGHMGHLAAIYFPRPEPADMLRTMDECGVRMLMFSHHSALFSPDLANTHSIAAVRAYPDRFRAYCVINPNYPALVEREVASFDALYPDVYVGFKFLSDYHQIALTDKRYAPAWELANARGTLVLAHTWGGSQYDGPDVVREVAERYPNVKFLLGHSCHGDWDAAVHIALDCPNVYLELTAVFDNRGAIEKFVHEVGSHRMLFGTDLPWFDPHHAVGVLLNADISDEDRHNICHRNAEKLLGPILDL